MQQSSRLRVHGRITGIDPETGGSATIRVELDAREELAGTITNIAKPLIVYCFYPNYWPPFFSLLDRVWLSLELYTEAGNISLATSRRVEIKSLNSKDKYEYRLAGNLFTWPKSSSTESVYLDCGVPMLLAAARDLTEAAKRGSPIEVSKGRIYGEVERPKFSTQ